MLKQAANLDRVFQALADPGRRTMVNRLTEGSASVSELAKPLSMSLAAVLQHVQVLEASGLIHSQKVGRTRTCSINASALRSAECWLSERRSIVERRLDRLGEYLADTADMADSPDRPGSRPTRPRAPKAISQSQSTRGEPMTMRSVIHDTFTIERTYPATQSRVFAAFASVEAKNAWGDTGDLEPADEDAGEEFDFRVGGRERFSHKWEGNNYRYDALYYDIVCDQRIVYSYEMYANDVRISVSIATIEFEKSGAGTALTYTEQGAYLDGIDGPEAPELRKGGTTEMLDNLTGYLQSQAAT